MTPGRLRLGLRRRARAGPLVGLALGVLLATLVDTSTQFDFTKANFEAAFQGRCGRESPCEQLCFELHDGMFECECRDGYVLHLNGYGCLVTPPTQYAEPDDEDEAEPAAGEQVTDYESILYSMGAEMVANQDESVVAAAAPNITVTSYVITPPRVPDASTARPGPSPTPRTTTAAPTPEPPRVQFVPVRPDEENALDGVLVEACPLDCGPGGACITETTEAAETDERHPQRCQCPLGRGGAACQDVVQHYPRARSWSDSTLTAPLVLLVVTEVTLHYPRFSGRGWLAFPALRAAYKRVSIHVEFRPEAWDGVLLLAGERDDLTGDYLAVVINKGFAEFRFDCGSGQGVVRSDETVLLNQWNRLSVHRHRWDATLRLNNGKRVAGRSKGLFSRITFREPLFLGGAGNTTGLAGKLPAERGLRGCVRHLEVNDQLYDFSEDAMQGFDVAECSSDRCSKVPCMHGGKCVTAGELHLQQAQQAQQANASLGQPSAVCLCPLGYSGELCETRVDLLVPSFNGSSFLRYPGLGDTALSWLDLQLTLKPTAANGLVMYNGHRSDGVGDFMALYMVDRHIEFSFDLGSGPATVRSWRPLSLGEWHDVRVSRTGRLAVLQVDEHPPAQVVSPGAFLQLSLPLSLYLGGVPAVPSFHAAATKTRAKGSFVGCIQKVLVNEKPLHLLASALAGVNVDNCAHPCAARPCGAQGQCVPQRDYFSCLCPGMAESLEPGLECPTHAEGAAKEAAKEAVKAAAKAVARGAVKKAVKAAPHDVEPMAEVGATVTATTTPAAPKHPDEHRDEHRVSAGFKAVGFMHFVDADTVRRSTSDQLRVNLRLRTTASSGLVLWTGRRREDDDEEVQAVHQRHGVHPSFGNDFLALAVQDGFVHLRLDLGSGELFLGYNLTRVDDGQWHRVVVVRRGQDATISVDNGPGLGRTAPGRLRQLNTNTGLYVGGVPDPARSTRGRYSAGLDGCVADLVLDEDHAVRLDSPSGESANVAACG
ncbi:pikachurin [Thrips palmi]|uniref:Pikachurin n=1 Tax=Thrips palmi TaxID=161013 RepID=A0A6P8Z4S6_THRPL|nr:pikachurin [Thrips palmi]